MLGGVPSWYDIQKVTIFFSPQVCPPPSWGGLTQACECAGGGGHETKGVHEPEGAAFWKWKDACMKERSCRSWNMWFFGNGKSEWYVFFFPGTIWQSHITFLQNTIEDEVAFFHGWDRLVPQNLSLTTDLFSWVKILFFLSKFRTTWED